MNINNKRGLIKVSNPVMHDHEVMKVIYSEFLPFRIDYEYLGIDTGIFNLYGWCDRFDEIKDGDILPQYDFMLKRSDDGSISITECNRF